MPVRCADPSHARIPKRTRGRFGRRAVGQAACRGSTYGSCRLPALEDHPESWAVRMSLGRNPSPTAAVQPTGAMLLSLVRARQPLSSWHQVQLFGSRRGWWPGGHAAVGLLGSFLGSKGAVPDICLWSYPAPNPSSRGGRLPRRHDVQEDAEKSRHTQVDPMQNKPNRRCVQRGGADNAEGPKRYTASVALQAVWDPYWCRGPGPFRRAWPDPRGRIRHRAQLRTTARSETVLLENTRSRDAVLAAGARMACCCLIFHRVYLADGRPMFDKTAPPLSKCLEPVLPVIQCAATKWFFCLDAWASPPPLQTATLGA